MMKMRLGMSVRSLGGAGSGGAKYWLCPPGVGSSLGSNREVFHEDGGASAAADPAGTGA